jgi:hypothetical protein
MARQDQAAKAKPEKPGDAENSTREEAKHLAEEAVQEMRRGNKEEADFVLDAARELDKHAADEVVKSKK